MTKLVIDISTTKNIYTEDFIKYLIKQMSSTTLNLLDKCEPELIRLEEYINSIPKIKSKLTKNLYLKDIVKIAAYNIKYHIFDNKIIVYINDTKYIPYSSLKIIDVCKLIDDGGVEVDGCNLFTNLFKYYNDNIVDYYAKYLGV